MEEKKELDKLIEEFENNIIKNILVKNKESEKDNNNLFTNFEKNFTSIKNKEDSDFIIFKEIFEFLKTKYRNSKTRENKLNVLIEKLKKSKIENFSFKYVIFDLFINIYKEINLETDSSWNLSIESLINFIKEKDLINSIIKSQLFNYSDYFNTIFNEKNYDELVKLLKDRLCKQDLFTKYKLDQKFFNNILKIKNGREIVKKILDIYWSLTNNHANKFKNLNNKYKLDNEKVIISLLDNPDFSDFKVIINKIKDSNKDHSNQNKTVNISANSSENFNLKEYENILIKLATLLFGSLGSLNNIDKNNYKEELKEINISDFFDETKKLKTIDDLIVKKIQNIKPEKIINYFKKNNIKLSDEFKQYIATNPPFNDYLFSILLYLEIEYLIYSIIDLLIRKEKVDQSILDKPERNNIREKIQEIYKYVEKEGAFVNDKYVLNLISTILYDIKNLNLRNVDIHKAQKIKNFDVKLHYNYDQKIRLLSVVTYYIIKLYETIEEQLGK